MFFQLDNLSVRLHCSDQQLNQSFSQLLEGWLSEPAAGRQPPAHASEVAVTFEMVDELPSRPLSRRVFSAIRTDLPACVNQLAVYESDETFWLDFSGSALVKLSGLTEQSIGGHIEGVVTAAVLRYGRLEDILFTCLAPFLRRRGLYLVHAFAASRDGRALLLVGPSGSGKTTTGLNLVHHGWQYLANDVVLLKQHPDGVYALPLPGGFNVAPQSWSLLPWLSERAPGRAADQPAIKRHLPAQQVVTGWGEPARVAVLCFPQVTQNEHSRYMRESQALSLARLMESSLDRWDQTCLAGHITLLQLLSSQAASYSLHLGQEVAHLPELLAELLFEKQSD